MPFTIPSGSINEILTTYLPKILAIQYLTKSLEAGKFLFLFLYYPNEKNTDPSILPRIDPSDAQGWYLLGRAYMAGQKYNKAYEAYQQAVYRDGRNPTFWCSIGVLYFQINQYRDALDAYSRAIRINPYISEVWFDLGSLYESCNNQISDAIDAYVGVAEFGPTNTSITLFLSAEDRSVNWWYPPRCFRAARCHLHTYANPLIPMPTV